jgi:hypothetical protein
MRLVLEIADKSNGARRATPSPAELGCSRVRPISQWSKSETSDFDWGEGGVRGEGTKLVAKRPLLRWRAPFAERESKDDESRQGAMRLARRSLCGYGRSWHPPHCALLPECRRSVRAGSECRLPRAGRCRRRPKCLRPAFRRAPCGSATPAAGISGRVNRRSFPSFERIARVAKIVADPYHKVCCSG